MDFATLSFPLSSVSAGSYCLLNDLYVVLEARGRGIGRALIARRRDHARERGHAALEWQTRRENATAQRLYDATGARRTAWYTYGLPTAPTDPEERRAASR